MGAWFTRALERDTTSICYHLLEADMSAHRQSFQPGSTPSSARFLLPGKKKESGIYGVGGTTEVVGRATEHRFGLHLALSCDSYFYHLLRVS